MDLNYEQLEQEILDVLGSILINPNIAMCFHNVQIEGKAESKGQVASRENEKIRMNVGRG